MVKKKSGMARRRKKSNTTTNEGAKRLKTAKQENPAEYRNGLLQSIRALLGKMDDKDLLAIMMYAGSMEGEKQKSTTSSQEEPTEPSPTVVTKATATVESSVELTATATASNHTTTTTTTTDAANPSTTEEATTTTVPPSPQEQQVIELSKKTRPSHDNIVTIDPRCFHCDGRTELAAGKCKNESINTIVNSIVQNNLTPEQRSFALKQAMVHPHLRALPKSAGPIDDQDVVKKNYILNNMKNVVKLAQETTKKMLGQMMIEGPSFSQLS